MGVVVTASPKMHKAILMMTDLPLIIPYLTYGKFLSLWVWVEVYPLFNPYSFYFPSVGEGSIVIESVGRLSTFTSSRPFMTPRAGRNRSLFSVCLRLNARVYFIDSIRNCKTECFEIMETPNRHTDRDILGDMKDRENIKVESQPTDSTTILPSVSEGTGQVRHRTHEHRSPFPKNPLR